MQLNMVRMNLIKSWAGGLLAALMFCLFTGCGTTNSNTMEGAFNQASPPPPAPSVGTFHVGDLVIVTFSGLSEGIPPHEERVKEDGTITLPQIGAVKAEGRTSGELQKDIRSKYVDGRLFSASLNITAGDFNDFANRKKVTVTRVDGRQFTVNCVKAQRDPKLDLPIYPGDTINVPRTWM
jgi:hypothetical protein